jgi:hypothetical protein
MWDRKNHLKKYIDGTAVDAGAGLMDVINL